MTRPRRPISDEDWRQLLDRHGITNTRVSPLARWDDAVDRLVHAITGDGSTTPATTHEPRGPVGDTRHD